MFYFLMNGVYIVHAETTCCRATMPNFCEKRYGLGGQFVCCSPSPDIQVGFYNWEYRKKKRRYEETLYCETCGVGETSVELAAGGFYGATLTRKWPYAQKVCQCGPGYLGNLIPGYPASYSEAYRSDVANKITNPRSRCTACPRGKAGGGQIGVCQICEPPYYARKEGVSECIKCAPGYVVDDDTHHCRICQTGKYANANFCYSCAHPMQTNPPGTQWIAGMVQGKDYCRFCPAGKQLVNYVCHDCDAGYTSTVGNPCTSCPAGFYSQKGSDVGCQACESGKYSHTGTANCIECDINTFRVSGAQTTECTSCERGKTTDKKTGAEECLTDQAHCLLSPREVGRIGYSPDYCGLEPTELEGNTCFCCSGQYMLKKNAQIVFDANLMHPNDKTYTHNNKTYDIMLPTHYDSGYTSPITNETIDPYFLEFLDMVQNLTSIIPEKTGCGPCPPNTYMHENRHRHTTCISCAEGKFSDTRMYMSLSEQERTNREDRDVIRRMIADTFHPYWGATECFVVSAAVSCDSCSVGKYKEHPGAFDCLSCPDPYTSTASTGSKACVCVPGYEKISSGACSSCPQSTYKMSVSDEPCSLCLRGTFASTKGHTICTECEAGKYKNDAGYPVISIQVAGNTELTQCGTDFVGTYYFYETRSYTSQEVLYTYSTYKKKKTMVGIFI